MNLGRLIVGLGIKLVSVEDVSPEILPVDRAEYLFVTGFFSEVTFLLLLCDISE